MSDLRFAIRQLAKAPGATCIIVLSLALGIGANTALFSVIDEVLLRSLPVERPDELVVLRWMAPKGEGMWRSGNGVTATDRETGLQTGAFLSYFIFERVRDHADVFSDVFAFANLDTQNVVIDGRAERAGAQVVTGGYFRGLGLRALRGRLLGPSDDRENAAPAMVISESFWRARFGGDDSAVGKTIRIKNVTFTIVGVTPRGFNGTLEAGQVPDLTIPMAIDPQLREGGRFFLDPALWRLRIMARLRSGVSIATATAGAEPVFMQAARDGWTSAISAGDGNATGRHVPRLRLEPGARGLMDMRREYAEPLRILSIIVALVLVIACTNVANLLLARAAVRRKEIAVRLSLGASRGQIVRQLLTESVMLALLGGVLGVLVAYWARDALVHLRSYGSSGPLELNLRVLGFAVGVSTVTGLIFGLVPAWQATRVDLVSVLKANAGAAGEGRARFGVRRVLMVVQVALSVVLLVSAGLFLRTLHNLRSVDAGFDRRQLVTFILDAGKSGYTQAQSLELFARLRRRIESLPGVESTAISVFRLLGGNHMVGGIQLDLPPEGKTTDLVASVNVVSDGYFSTLQIPLLAGRDLTAHDIASDTRVAVVNESFAREMYPAENPVGHVFSFGDRKPIQIVGVVRDARFVDLRQTVGPTVYRSLGQDDWRAGVFLVRIAGDPRAFATAIRGVVHETDPNVPLFDLRTQEEQIDRLLAQERLFASLSTCLSVVALVLTCAGLYGLLAHQVTARTREIGIRLALGAQVAAVMKLILGEGVRLAAMGVVIGCVVAAALSGFVSKLLFEVPALDPLALGGSAVLLMVVVLAACATPARRATKVDPMVALRAE